MDEQAKWEVRAAVRGSLGAAVDTTAVQLFPVYARATAAVPASRRRALRAHLEREAMSEPLPSAPRSAAQVALDAVPVGAICGTCRGFCCVSGGDRGYLTAATLRRSAALVPGDIIEHYMSLVPRRAYAGSCIFHAVAGCALPRDLRSDICNGHLCPPLRQIAESWLADPAQPVIAAFTEPGKPRRIAVVRNMTARRVPTGPRAGSR